MELEWLKKSLTSSDAHELRRLINHDHPELRVSRQCALLGLPRSTLYYQPIPESELTLRVIARIGALNLEDPCSGIRRIVDCLAREGITISCDRVRTSCVAWAHGRSSRSGAPRFKGIHPNACRAWWMSHGHGL